MNRPSNPATAPQIIANASYWFERELCSYTEVRPDRDVLTRHADRVVPAVGRSSRGYPTYTTGVMLGEMLDRAVLEMPGGHTGYITDTAEFAAELLVALN